MLKISEDQLSALRSADEKRFYSRLNDGMQRRNKQWVALEGQDIVEAKITRRIFDALDYGVSLESDVERFVYLTIDLIDDLTKPHHAKWLRETLGPADDPTHLRLDRLAEHLAFSEDLPREP